MVSDTLAGRQQNSEISSEPNCCWPRHIQGHRHQRALINRPYVAIDHHIACFCDANSRMWPRPWLRQEKAGILRETMSRRILSTKTQNRPKSTVFCPRSESTFRTSPHHTAGRFIAPYFEIRFCKQLNSMVSCQRTTPTQATIVRASHTYSCGSLLP